MACNKVIFKGETLIDLTSDTVTTATLGKGATAHDKSGNQIVGTMDGSDLIDSLIDRSITSISSNVEIVGSNAFYGCTSLTSVSFPNATTVEDCAFYGCTSLTSIDLPKVTSIDSCVFFNCTSLTSVSLPNATTVEDCAFYGCTSLTSIDLPKVTSIDSLAFVVCSQLETLILRSLTVATLLDTDAFNSTQIESGTGYIYVPAGLIDQYKTATNWTEYADQFRAIEDYSSICGNDDVCSVDVTAIDGTSTSYRLLKGTKINFNVNATSPSRITAVLKTDQSGYQAEQTEFGSCENYFYYKFDTSPTQTYAETGVSESLQAVYDSTAHRQTITADDLVPTEFTVTGDMTIVPYLTETNGVIIVLQGHTETPDF